VKRRKYNSGRVDKRMGEYIVGSRLQSFSERPVTLDVVVLIISTVPHTKKARILGVATLKTQH
jgi:hypothetical protein